MVWGLFMPRCAFRLGVWACGTLLAFLPVAAPAQDLLHPQTREAREAEFESLREDATWIEKFNQQTKRVARFVQPTVVHIEAHKVDGRRTIDEAGSGTVVEIEAGDGPYVDLLLDVGAPLIARITRRSAEHHGFSVGEAVYASIKTAAIDRHSLGRGGKGRRSR